jgi:hypothetical protein
MNPVWSKSTRLPICSCNLDVSILVRILTLQFCRHIGLKASTGFLAFYGKLISLEHSNILRPK